MKLSKKSTMNKITSGLIVVNKPSGITSRDVVNILNKKFNTKIIGHIGTLDPLASGVLVCLIGKYTKLTNILINHDKEYIASFKLGMLTDSLDITGNILKEEKVNVNKEEVMNTLNSFVKTYEQEVPIYSAVKVNGKKLYEYAREGIEVKLPKKDVTIYDIELLDIKEDLITIKTKVSKGTYIRALINDIAKDLGTYGTMTKLDRIKLGSFKIEDAYSIDDILNDNYRILSLEDFLDIEVINVSDCLETKIRNGNKIDYETDRYILFKKDNNMIALYGKINEKEIKPIVMF